VGFFNLKIQIRWVATVFSVALQQWICWSGSVHKTNALAASRYTIHILLMVGRRKNVIEFKRLVTGLKCSEGRGHRFESCRVRHFTGGESNCSCLSAADGSLTRKAVGEIW
jgi:phage gp37-like protein